MRLKLWQQFSSNHSASFTVVGEFPSHTEAAHAAEEVRLILKRISDWYHEDWRARSDWYGDPTPPEREIAHQYNIDWSESVEWYDNARIETAFDRFVIVTLNPHVDSHGTGQPFDQIMNRLGGKGYVDGDNYEAHVGSISYNLTCTAPDEAVAQSIYAEQLASKRWISRQGRTLTFERWWYEENPLTEVIPYLQAQGCVDIQFSLQQVWMDTETPPGYSPEQFDLLVDVVKYARSQWERIEAVRELGFDGDARILPALQALLSEADTHLAPEIQRAINKILTRTNQD